MITEQEAIKLVEKEYPDHKAEVVADVGGVFYVNISIIGEENGIADLHTVDKKTGKVSGNIPTMKILDNPEVADQIFSQSKKKNEISETEDHLAHHGIKGQKWGERNGPPYPLDQKTHNDVVAGSKKESSKTDGKSFDSIRNAHGKDNVNGITPETATLAVYAVTLLSSLAIRAIAYKSAVKREANYNDYAAKDNDALSKKHISDYADVKDFSDETPPKKIEGEHSIEDDVAAINPTFDETIDYTATNCALCSVTYDLRRRGYDLTAKLSRKGTMIDKLVKDVYGFEPDMKPVSESTWDSVLDAKKRGLEEGARGLISVGTPYANMRHCMSFEVQDGKLRVIDAQCNNTDIDMKSDKWKYYAPYLTQIVRLDDKEPKIKGINYTSAELKSDWKQHVPSKQSNDKAVDNFVKQYKKDHPNSQLSDKEIANFMNLEAKHSASTLEYGDYLAHHGIKGQKWGVRRFQNDDGSLTEEGIKRYRNFNDAVNNWNKSRMKRWTPRRELKNKELERKIDQAREPLKEVTDNLDVDAYRKSVMKGDYDDFVNLRKMRVKANDELKNDKKLLEQTAEKRLDDIKELYKRFSKKSKFSNDRYKEYEAMTDEDRKKWVKEEAEDFFSSIDAHDNLLDTYIDSVPEYKKLQDKEFEIYKKYENVPYFETLFYAGKKK